MARTHPAIFNNAIALCNGAHLATLKAFDKKVLDMCTQSLSTDTGLRTVNTQELLQAASLHAEGWSLDEALHEMTSTRADTHALLQPRAKSPLQNGGKGKQGKGGGKKGGKVQNKFRDEKSVGAVAEAMKNLQLKHGNKTLCLRFNRASCTDANCKFTHMCAHRLPNGQARGQKHPASASRFKPADKAEAPPAPPPST